MPVSIPLLLKPLIMDSPRFLPSSSASPFLDLMPPVRPCTIYSPNSANILEGDSMPRSLQNPSTTLDARFFIHSTAAEMAFVMPFASPSTILVPISAHRSPIVPNAPNTASIAYTIASAINIMPFPAIVNPEPTKASPAPKTKHAPPIRRSATAPTTRAAATTKSPAPRTTQLSPTSVKPPASLTRNTTIEVPATLMTFLKSSIESLQLERVVIK